MARRFITILIYIFPMQRKILALAGLGLGLGGLITGIMYLRNKKATKSKNNFELTNSKRFLDAAQQVQKMGNLSQDNKLNLYGLYKQATEGDCNLPKPPLYEIANTYKWEHWDKHRGLSKPQAEIEYINLGQQLQGNQSHSNNTNPNNMGFGIKVSTMKSSDADNNDAYRQKFNLSDDNKPDVPQPFIEKLNQHIQRGEIQELEKLMSDHPNQQEILQANNRQGITLLHQAVDSDKIDVLKYLIPLYQKHNLIDVKDDVSGMTALHYAVLSESDDMILMLTKAGANPHVKDFSEDTAFEALSDAMKKQISLN